MKQPRSFTPCSVGLFLASALALASGCGESRNSAPVSGRVTLNGEPQVGIFVYFSLVPGPKADLMNVGAPAFCRTDAEGRYALRFMDDDRDGALIGASNVRMADERTFENPNIKSRVPLGWTATFTVPPKGTTEADFELSDGRKK